MSEADDSLNIKAVKDDVDLLSLSTPKRRLVEAQLVDAQIENESNTNETKQVTQNISRQFVETVLQDTLSNIAAIVKPKEI